MNPADFDTLASFLKIRSGLVLGTDKLYLLETRLAPILKQHGLRDLPALAAVLRSPVPPMPLATQVVEAMTTNESFFFRDEKPFAHFRDVLLPRLHAARPPGQELRIWSAAASSGQEAYSLAMCVAENRTLLQGRPVRIIGTDIATGQIVRARAGLYTQFEVQRGLPVQMLVKYFRKEDDGWRVHPALRDIVSFREWNLLSDLAGLGQFDVVFCRNVLIYFDQTTKARVLDAIARLMPPDGALVLGGAETLVGLQTQFGLAPVERGVYAKEPPREAACVA